MTHDIDVSAIVGETDHGAPAVYATEEWVQGLTQEQLMCRGFGHEWDIGSSQCRLLRDGRFHSHLLTCTRCGAQRYEVVATNTGKLVSREYVWPDGYGRPPDAFPVPRSAFRAAATQTRPVVHGDENLQPAEEDPDRFGRTFRRWVDEARPLTYRQVCLADPARCDLV
jgi:hypothetical protein